MCRLYTTKLQLYIPFEYFIFETKWTGRTFKSNHPIKFEGYRWNGSHVHYGKTENCSSCYIVEDTIRRCCEETMIYLIIGAGVNVFHHYKETNITVYLLGSSILTKENRYQTETVCIPDNRDLDHWLTDLKN